MGSLAIYALEQTYEMEFGEACLVRDAFDVNILSIAVINKQLALDYLSVQI